MVFEGCCARWVFLIGIWLSVGTAAGIEAQSSLMDIAAPVSVDEGIHSVAGVGDVDLDGYPDFAVGYFYLSRIHRVLVYSGRDGRVIYTFVGTKGIEFGHSLAGVGDVNADGYPDIAVGSPGDGADPVGDGSVRVYSGKDGSVLRYWRGGRMQAVMGWTVAHLGDVDKDGYDDVLVGLVAGTLPNLSTNGEVQVRSGKSGAILLQVIGRHPGVLFSWGLCGAGDVDGDGCPDFCAADVAGRVASYSGKNGKVIMDYSTILYSYPVLANVGDIDKDGVADLGIGTPGTSNSTGILAGSVSIFSNRTGKLLHRVEGTRWDYMAASVGLGDVDGDGYGDFAVGAGQCHTGSTRFGYMKAFSGRTGQLLFTLYGRVANECFGGGMALIGDIVGDKTPEILVTAPFTLIGGKWNGRLVVLSTKTLSFLGHPYKLSLKTAGSQTLELNPGGQYAGQNYWIFGTVTGTRPGTVLGAHTVPLNLDYYTNLTIADPNAIYFTSFQGKLGPQGKALATFNVPSGLPTLPPFTLNHSYVVYDQQGNIHAVSNAVSIRLE